MAVTNRPLGLVGRERVIPLKLAAEVVEVVLAADLLLVVSEEVAGPPPLIDKATLLTFKVLALIVEAPPSPLPVAQVCSSYLFT